MLASTLVVGGAATACASAGSAPVHHPSATAATSAAWVGTWAASPMAPTALTPGLAQKGFAHQTVRNVVFTSVGGDQVRIRLGNTFGSRPLHIGHASIGVVRAGAELVAGTSRPLTFAHHASTTIATGSQTVSDPVTFKVAPLEQLAVSVYLSAATGPATSHQAAQQTGYVATGDETGTAASTPYHTTDPSWFFLDGLDVHEPSAPGTVVALGDSITDGHRSTVGANDRWPNDLARRLDAGLGDSAPAVEDEGIGGNRVLHDSPCFGQDAVTRFQRDVLAQPGVKDVILLQGIDDIVFSQNAGKGCFAPNTAVTAAQIEAGYRQLISAAHAHGLKIYGGTLTPFRGAAHWSPTLEAEREAVNTWIETSHAFDGVIDFAQAVQDPHSPQRLDPADDSGDHLHPDDAGYRAMASAVDPVLVK